MSVSDIEKRETILKSFLKEWPLERVKKMTLEEYTNLDNNSFNYWLEIKTRDILGIGGGSAYKFGIYKFRNKPKIRGGQNNDNEYAWSTKYGKDRDEAFNTIKLLIVKTIELALKGYYNEIDNIDFSQGIKWKIAVLYSSGKLIHIVEKEALYHNATRLGFTKDIDSSQISELHEFLINKRPLNIDNYSYSDELWEDWLNQPKNYWKIAAGESGTLWDEFQKNNEIRIGFHPVPDLSTFKNKKELSDFIRKNEVVKGVKQEFKADEIWNFFNLKEGDLVLANKGVSGILGFGKVSGEYFYNDSYEQYKHCVPVQWYDTKFRVLDLPQVWKFSTLIKLKEDEFQRFYNNSPNVKEPVRLINHSLNTILYGPPGTGKTYVTKNYALSIIEGVDYNNTLIDRETLSQKYIEYVKSGQIDFISFHQSFSYEDFIEGIKPEENNGNINYRVTDGILKKICDRAKRVSNFDDIYNQFLEDLAEGEILLNTMSSRKRQFKISIDNDNSIFYQPSLPDNRTSPKTKVHKEDLEKCIKGQQFEGNIYFINAIKDYILGKYQINFIDNSSKNYVLIIDEINRGNIANIFGELITLIETDKRENGKESLSTTLPYSKEPFSVPSNLYILGTMNTADRSIEALDTALRRRFSFIEMRPKPEMLSEPGYKCKNIDLEKLLKTINARIEKLLDKDHCIGHSYFMSIRDRDNPFAELKEIFRNKIIPLLQEYFYGDMSKIGLILGSTFIEKKYDGDKIDFKSGFKDTDNEEYHDKIVYDITPEDKWNFEDIYA